MSSSEQLPLENGVSLEQALGTVFEDPLSERFIQDLFNLSSIFKTSLELSLFQRNNNNNNNNSSTTINEEEHNRLINVKNTYDKFNQEFQERIRHIRQSFSKDEKLNVALKQYKEYFHNLCDTLLKMKKENSLDDFLSEQERAKVLSTKRVSEQFVLLFEKVLRDSKLLSNSNITLTERMDAFKKLNEHYRKENEILRQKIEKMESSPSSGIGGSGENSGVDPLEFRELYEKRLTLLENNLRERDEETRQLRIQILDLKQRLMNVDPSSSTVLLRYNEDQVGFATTISTMDQQQQLPLDPPPTKTLIPSKLIVDRMIELNREENTSEPYSLTPTELKFSQLANNVELNMKKAREMLSVLWDDVNQDNSSPSTEVIEL